MCDCIEKVEKMLTDKMREQNPNAEIVEEVCLENKAYMLGTGRYQLYSPSTGRYLQGKSKRKFAPSMYFTYCPFCGKKYKSKE